MKYFYYSLKAKYWVFNSKMANYMYKRKNQVYFQTWHGTPLKRLAHDIQNENQTFYRTKMSYADMLKTYDVDSEKWDLLLASSNYMRDRYASAFQYSTSKMLMAPYPRNNILLNYDDNYVAKLKEQFKLPDNKKVILYAPTFRDDNYTDSGYSFQLNVNFEHWYESLGDEYVVLFKPHYLIANTFTISEKLKKFVQFVPANAEINDCYLVSDVLVTDYSSVFFDYALLNRPIYFYMYDFENYKDVLRGFYLDVESELPNKIIQDESELLDAIKDRVFDPNTLQEFNDVYNPLIENKSITDIIDRFITYK
ncbi:CDP-glycerol glycerophosphotransferase family protein [Weissella ceti]|uniref:CDP-glycerol glycerophosphotransferase family protein n=2 Tax=Weissella ceti TaxID=759620 RepID=A0ABT3E5N8_9LACO|nr:CDP-glycerol glycerophosphotransferase family protein [Weissella ceti]MCW0953735.1 CDP-glycerol glycerophosphotransferase family protein [Weissella ceti]